MKRGVKEYLIPHKENEHKPYIFRAAGVVVLTLLIGGLFFGSVAHTNLITSPNFSAVISSVLVDLTNEDRHARQLAQLTVDEKLQQAAQLKANDMAQKGYFAHQSPEGVTPWHWFREAGYEFANAGENLAVNFSDSIQVEQAWMNSPGHRANILNGNFTEIGIATAQGVYEGRQTTFVVQMFGTPAAPRTSPQEPVSGAPAEQTPAEQAPAEEDQSPAEQTPAEDQEPSVVAGTDSEDTENTDVLSEQAVEVIAEDDMFIAVENTAATPAPAESRENVDYAPWYAELAASPDTLLKWIYTALAGLILIGLLLTIFVEIRKQHIAHILAGVFLLVLIIALLCIGREFIFPEVIIKEALGS